MTVKVPQKHPEMKEIVRADISLLAKHFFVSKAENENSLHSSKPNSDTDGERYQRIRAPHYRLAGHFTSIFHTITTSVR